MTAPRHDLAICFVAPAAYPALSGRTDIPHFGGAEKQQVLLARALLKRGVQVSFVTMDHGQPDVADCQGITVYKAYSPDAGLPGLRLLYPRATRLWSAMRSADADVYYQRMAEWTTGVVAAFCRRHGKPFVFGLAHDFNCMCPPPTLRTRRERTLYRYGLRRANHVIAQTQHQHDLLLGNYAVESTVMPNCSPPPDRQAASARYDEITPRPRRVLWMGRFSPEKRPELMFEIAALCPQIEFEVVGDSLGSSDYAHILREKAAALPNVVLRGWVPYADASAFYDRAGLLLCTSSAEGFPNTFLEAWSRGAPVASTLDLDGRIAAHGLGVVSQDKNTLAHEICRLLIDMPQDGIEMGQRAARYCAEHFSETVVVDQFESLLHDVVRTYSGATSHPTPD